MKNSKTHFSSAGQSATEVKKSQKHDANLQKNSTLYFQIGLILCLLGTYGLLEMQFQEKKLTLDTVETNELATIDVVEQFRVEPDVLPETKQEQVRSTVVSDKVTEVKDDVVIKDVVDLIVTDPTPVINKPVSIGDIDIIDTPEENPIVDFIRVEDAPIYPGCEKFKDNDARKRCMSGKITKLVGSKFNTNLGSEYGLSGIQKIQTQFTIDKNGNVVDVKVRAPHAVLEKEAKRIIDKIPLMKPGYQGNKAVGVVYNLPITFQVRN